MLRCRQQIIADNGALLGSEPCDRLKSDPIHAGGRRYDPTPCSRETQHEFVDPWGRTNDGDVIDAELVDA